MKEDGWREVSRGEFYDTVGFMDVTPYPQGEWPYLSVWKNRYGTTVAKIERSCPDGKPEERHLLADAL